MKVLLLKVSSSLMAVWLCVGVSLPPVQLSYGTSSTMRSEYMGMTATQSLNGLIRRQSRKPDDDGFFFNWVQDQREMDEWIRRLWFEITRFQVRREPRLERSEGTEAVGGRRERRDTHPARERSGGP